MPEPLATLRRYADASMANEDIGAAIAAYVRAQHPAWSCRTCGARFTHRQIDDARRARD